MLLEKMLEHYIEGGNKNMEASTIKESVFYSDKYL